MVTVVASDPVQCEDIMERKYKNAIQMLNGRRRPKRPVMAPPTGLTDLVKMPSLKGSSDMKGTPSIVGMKDWLHQIGHSGKGSTCAFIESFLRAHGRRTGFPRKTGLYTSPHLIYPEERIRIDFEPLRRDLFAQYFYEVYDALSKAQAPDFYTRPRYLQLLALVAFHAFIREGVEAAVVETHHGGEYDATNVINAPVVTAITPLGMDHVQQLGPSIENIAWHKAGIFKAGALAFSAPQDPEAAEVLRQRASDRGADVQFIGVDQTLPDESLSLKPDVQRLNASLALAVVRAFLSKWEGSNSNIMNADDISQGLEQFAWPGRFQLVIQDQFQWFLDAAHNEMSVDKAAEWFMESSRTIRTSPTIPRVLIFSHISDQRDAREVFDQLAKSLEKSEIQHVIITAYNSHQSLDKIYEQPPVTMELSEQKVFFDIWKRTHPETTIKFEPTVQEAVKSAKNIGEEHGGLQTLITGSQYLVGGALFHLQQTSSAAS